VRALVVNKFGFVRGGLERVMFDEIEMLREAGHEVELFSTAHGDNLPARFEDRFPPYREFGPGGGFSARAVAQMFWNDQAAQAVRGVLEEYQPDVVHCHGIHRHLSPSVAAQARRAGIPVILTAHDFFLICPANTLLRGGTEPCAPRRCGTRQYFSAAGNRCVQGSVARSALAAVELTFQRAMRTYERSVDVFVAPSDFAAGAMILGGLPKERITVIRNSVRVSAAGVTRPAGPGEGFLYVGRLSREKGVEHAIEAARRCGAALTVAGDGPLGETLRAKGGAEFLGHIDSGTLAGLVARARAVVVPSICYENAPMAVLEGMAAATPVIASRIGGIPEQIEDGVSGILVEPGDVHGLSQAMKRLHDDEALASEMGERARRIAQERFSPERHLEALLGTYETAGSGS